MSVQGSPEFQSGLDPNWRVDGSPIEALALVENRERKQAFEELSWQMRRLHSYGQNSPSEAFYETPINNHNGSGNRMVLIRRNLRSGYAAEARVIVNDETTGLHDERQLNIKEFLVADRYPKISFAESLLKRGRYDSSWKPDNNSGPVMRKYNGMLAVCSYRPAPELSMPTAETALRHAMDCRILARKLCGILASLTEATLEPDYRIVYK